jgi:hypothetical protein
MIYELGSDRLVTFNSLGSSFLDHFDDQIITKPLLENIIHHQCLMFMDRE